jgi:hypothetical protein
VIPIPETLLFRSRKTGTDGEFLREVKKCQELSHRAPGPESGSQSWAHSCPANGTAIIPFYFQVSATILIGSIQFQKLPFGLWDGSFKVLPGSLTTLEGDVCVVPTGSHIRKDNLKVQGTAIVTLAWRRQKDLEFLSWKSYGGIRRVAVLLWQSYLGKLASTRYPAPLSLLKRIFMWWRQFFGQHQQENNSQD